MIIKPYKRNTILIDNIEYYPLKNYEGLYYISENGEVYSNYQKKILKKGKHRNGYVLYHLWKDKKVKKILGHRLVAETFLGNIENMVINHLDLNKQNNNVKNLEITNIRENLHHYLKTTKKEIGIIALENNIFRVVLNLNNKPIHLGQFKNIDKAIAIRDKALEMIKNGLDEKSIKELYVKPKYRNYRYNKGKYEVTINNKYLGRFDNENEAIEFIKKYRNDNKAV